jgi:hypothetical protein
MFRPFLRIFLRFTSVGDHWKRIDVRIPVHKLGVGSRHEFSWYFEGQSRVGIATIQDIMRWLLSCEYVSDPDLFHEPDFWQHPTTFEQLRRGDCEDHALWAWRKLLEIGCDAVLVFGRRLPWQPNVKGKERGHAWILLSGDDGVLLFEPSAKSIEKMLRQRAEVASEYRPEIGVDRNRKTFAYNGLLQSMREREFGIEAASRMR